MKTPLTVLKIGYPQVETNENYYHVLDFFVS